MSTFSHNYLMFDKEKKTQVNREHFQQMLLEILDIHMLKKGVRPVSPIHTKTSSTVVKDLKLKPEKPKLLDENTRNTILDIS